MTFWLTEGYETAKKTFKTFQVKHKNYALQCAGLKPGA